MYAEQRNIYIFYNDAGKEWLAKQDKELKADEQGLQDRDLLIHAIHTDSRNELIQKWRIDSTKPFTFILVGKDGTEKLRSHTLVKKEKLFSLIDAMPMRKSEMRKQ